MYLLTFYTGILSNPYWILSPMYSLVKKMDKKAIAIVAVVCFAFLFTPAIVDNSEAATSYSADPSIDEAGYVISKESLFYYAKFALLGFPLTDGSPSKDKPTAQMGTKFFENSIYVDLIKLDKDKAYKVKIAEFASKDAATETASVAVTTTAGSTHAFLWYSTAEGHNDTVYQDGTAIASPVFSGTFTTTPESQIFKVTLMDDTDKVLSEYTVDNIKNFTKIAHVSTINYTNNEELEIDLLQSVAKEFGFSKTSNTKTEYASNVLDATGFGKYAFAVFITNVENPVIKLSDGNSYTATANDIHFWMTNTGAEQTSGYGCVAVYSGADTGNFKNFDKYTLTIGDAENDYASENVNNTPAKNASNNVLLLGAAAILGILVVAFMAVFLVKGRSA